MDQTSGRAPDVLIISAVRLGFAEFMRCQEGDDVGVPLCWMNAVGYDHAGPTRPENGAMFARHCA